MPDLNIMLTRIRRAKDASGLTNQELSDLSGIPYNSVCTITAGTAKQATLSNVAALCAVLGLSLDEISGLRGSDEAAYIHKLEIENAKLTERVEHFRHFSTIYRPLIFGLIEICTILLCAVTGYIIFDMQLKNIGLFRSSGLTVLAVFLSVAVLAAVALIAFALKAVAHDARIIKRQKDKEE